MMHNHTGQSEGHRCIGMHEIVQLYRCTSTPPWNSSWAGIRESTTKHTTSMLETDRGGKGKQYEDVRKHGIVRAQDDVNGASLVRSRMEWYLISMG